MQAICAKAEGWTQCPVSGMRAICGLSPAQVCGAWEAWIVAGVTLGTIRPGVPGAIPLEGSQDRGQGILLGPNNSSNLLRDFRPVISSL